jgi:hypothetical protein
MEQLRPFHLAFPVDDLALTRKWYTEVLGCKIGRESNNSCVFNFFGHQIVAHLVAIMPEVEENGVDNKIVPTSHFGCVLEWRHWQEMSSYLLEKNVEFIIEPYIRYRGESGEQATMFFQDPCGNNLEFKAFKDDEGIFLPYS